MKILLVRPKTNRSIGVLSFVKVEPLELEYLAAICSEELVEYEIYDGSIERKKLENKYKNFDFDAVVISGYVNSIDVMKKYAKDIKGKNSKVKVIIGGVVAEVVPELLYSSHIDIILYSGGFEPFRKLMAFNFECNRYKSMKGICFQEVGNWIKNEVEEFDIKKLPLPNREHFYKNANKFRYLKYKPIALIKTAYSCPYECTFCYCKKLNRGKYLSMDLNQILKEIEAVDCEWIWIVDDIFLLDRTRATEFIDAMKRLGCKKKFIVYSRADFIVKNRDLLITLKEIGIQMIIVGLEAVNIAHLEKYNKWTDGESNSKCVQYLKESGISCMGLFIAGIDYKKEDFKNLRKWIEETGLEKYTISIFTPLPGTEEYEKYKEKILFKGYERYDFLHLLIEPFYLSRKRFYFEFYKLYLPYLYTLLRKVIKKF